MKKTHFYTLKNSVPKKLLWFLVGVLLLFGWGAFICTDTTKKATVKILNVYFPEEKISSNGYIFFADNFPETGDWKQAALFIEGEIDSKSFGALSISQRAVFPFAEKTLRYSSLIHPELLAYENSKQHGSAEIVTVTPLEVEQLAVIMKAQIKFEWENGEFEMGYQHFEIMLKLSQFMSCHPLTLPLWKACASMQDCVLGLATELGLDKRAPSPILKRMDSAVNGIQSLDASFRFAAVSECRRLLEIIDKADGKEVLSLTCGNHPNLSTSFSRALFLHRNRTSNLLITSLEGILCESPVFGSCSKLARQKRKSILGILSHRWARNSAGNCVNDEFCRKLALYQQSREQSEMAIHVARKTMDEILEKRGIGE